MTCSRKEKAKPSSPSIEAALAIAKQQMMTPQNAREKAVEAWNTWRGRYTTPKPEQFREVNLCNSCAEIIRDHLYEKFEENDHFIRGYVMHPNGSIISPWPYFDKATYDSIRRASPDTDMSFVFKLRSRWCIMFPSIIEYREDIFTILNKNDDDNIIINTLLHGFNDRLVEYGFPIFEKNDLRGINLGGFEFSGSPYAGVKFKKIDFSFSELSCIDLTGANLYKSKLFGTSSYGGIFNYAIMNGIDLSCSQLVQSSFRSSDLSQTCATNSSFLKCKFLGTDFSNSDIRGANFFEALIDQDDSDNFCELKYPNFKDMIFNSTTSIHLSKNESRKYIEGKMKNIIKNDNKEKSVFIVHGRDDSAKESVARFLEINGIKPIILHEQPNFGMTLIEKFEFNAANTCYAIVIMTPDDFGYLATSSPKNKSPRARQNVIFELGFFFAHLKRKNVFVLKKGEIEIPSDTPVVYEPMDEHGGWKMRLLQALKNAGFDVDANKII